jgi:carbamoyltransferase
MATSKIINLVGINKGSHDSSAALIRYMGNDSKEEVALTERITRKKYDGSWPIKALQKLGIKSSSEKTLVCETRYGINVQQHEEFLDTRIPFLNLLEKNNLQFFCNKFNNEIVEIGHHQAHAYSTLSHSPFQRSLILVIDGSGSLFEGCNESSINNFDTNGDKIDRAKKQLSESISVYAQVENEITCLEKYWQYGVEDSRFPKGMRFSGIGMFYEYIASYIFNSPYAAGKVMGLSSFEDYDEDLTSESLLNSLDWSKAFSGKTKSEWESSKNLNLYKKIASNTQKIYEDYLLEKVKELKRNYPDYENLIITGGCALNCVANSMVREAKIFKNIYIPPFPDDKGISFGCANYLKYKTLGIEWSIEEKRPTRFNYGKKYSLKDTQVRDLFNEFEIIDMGDKSPSYLANLLNEKKVIALYDGESETGARALGHRSILAGLDVDNLKNYLNENIKFREDFRPYGSSCLQEYVSKYFSVDESFSSPFMSFTPKVRSEYLKSFKEICHVDGTSRVQTVSKSANSYFYQIIKAYGDLSGTYCVLNTSFNIMGEPIIETIEDCRSFLDSSPVYGMAIDNFFIKNKK